MSDDPSNDPIVAPYAALQRFEQYMTRHSTHRHLQQFSLDEWNTIFEAATNVAEQVKIYLRAQNYSVMEKLDIEERILDLGAIEEVVHRLFRSFGKQGFDFRKVKGTLSTGVPCYVSIYSNPHFSHSRNQLRNIEISCHQDSDDSSKESLYSILRPRFGAEPFYFFQSDSPTIKSRSMPLKLWDRIDAGSEYFGIDYTSLPEFVEKLMEVVRKDHSYSDSFETYYTREMKKQDLARAALEHLLDLPVHIEDMLAQLTLTQLEHKLSGKKE